jgi:hypothetical protein
MHHKTAFILPAVLCVLSVAACKQSPQPAPVADAPIPAAIPAIARAVHGGRRVLFVGLDGADWQLLDGYMQAGLMPNLAALAKEGRTAALSTIHPPLSPLVWTTMMTGTSPLDHGILDFTRRNPATGNLEPITSGERRVPAIWNLATEAGRSVAVFGLWATWPAEPVRGLLVADRLSSFTRLRKRGPGRPWRKPIARWTTTPCTPTSPGSGTRNTTAGRPRRTPTLIR